jgi:Ca-activated chloride channel family protein
MEWLHPSYAWCLLALPFVLGGAWWAAVQRRRIAARFGDPALVQTLARAVRPARRYWKTGLRALGVTLLALSLMGPRYGTEVRTIERTGVDLVIALDVSASMRAEDVAPNRLARAKREIKALLDRLGGDRVGLVVFAGDGFVQCPLTTDYNAVRLFLDVATPNLMPTPGTDFGAALRAARQAFRSQAPPRADTASTRRTQALLVVSDGENHVGSVREVRAAAKEEDLRLFAAGVGETTGVPIPLYQNGKRIGVKRDRAGQVVQTRLEADALTALADPGGYARIGRTESTLMDVATALNQLEGTTVAEEEFAAYREVFAWPLAAGLLLLTIDLLLPARARVSSV